MLLSFFSQFFSASQSAIQRSLFGLGLGLLLLALFSQNPLLADSAVAKEAQQDSAATRAAIDAWLTKFDPNAYSTAEETEGFDFLFTSSFFGAFDYDIYGGSISSRIDQTVVRIEGGTGDAFAVARMLELEGILKPGETVPYSSKEPPEAVALDPKSQWIGQGLNLVAPWISVFYSSYDSPRLGFGQTWLRAGLYFLADAFMVAMGGTNFFQEGFDSSENGGLIGGLLVLPRIVGAVQSYNLTRGHNRMAEFKYTFYFD